MAPGAEPTSTSAFDPTAAFYRYELPDELNRAGSATTQRLDAPRSKAEIYFSIVQRKVLTPNDFADLDTLERQLLASGRRYEQIATPFEWTFTRADLDRLARRLDLTRHTSGLTEYVGELPSQST